MMKSLAENWANLVAHAWQAIAIAYFAAGIIAVGYITLRCSTSARRPSDTFPWPRRENPRQGLDLFLFAGSFHPVVAMIQVVLWPLWLLLLWAWEPEEDEGDDEPTI